MVQLIFQTLFVLGIVPFVLAVLWLLGVPYKRQTEDALAAQHQRK